MREDLAGWLAPNGLYPGVADALRSALADAASDVSIVTTKQARFTHTLLRDLAGVDLPMERIYSQVRGVVIAAAQRAAQSNGTLRRCRQGMMHCVAAMCVRRP